MGLVQIGFLGALGALAVPIIIHLVFGWRVRRVDLGTLRFLKIVFRENVRRRRLKRWLLLALRMTCLALLAFLFARPYLAARQAGGGNQLLVILLDRSASMGLKTGRNHLFELALGEANKVASDCGDEAQVEIALFDHDVHPIVGGGGSGTGLAASLAGLDTLAAHLGTPGVGYSATNYEAALAWARDRCVQSDRRRKELYVFTDLQRSGLTATGVPPMPADVDVHLVDLGQAFAANTAVTRVMPSRLTARPGEPITLTATLLNAGQFPLKGVPVVLRLDGSGGRQEIRSTIDLDAGATGTTAFELQDLGEGLWQGYVAVQADDGLPFDNRRYVALMVAAPLQVILVDGDPGESPLTAETFFLEAALRLAPSGESFVDSPFEPNRVVLGERGGLPDLRAAALVVLANVGGLPPGDARRLGEFVRQGGGLLVFSGENVRDADSRALQDEGLSAGKIVGTATAASLPWRLDNWDAD